MLAILGQRLWWAMAGPLLYLYFLVPFGEFLTPQLQDITTWFIRHGLDGLGIPAYIDGYIIEIPQGTFFVAEACAGLRFLIASIAFGSLYSLVMYRSPLRRGLFMLISIVVPVIANGVRALGIVLAGYLLGSAQAAAADHLIYGWVFFSLVILLLIALGLPFRQDHQPPRSVPKPEPPSPPGSMRQGLLIALGVIIIAAIGPAVATALTTAATFPPAVAEAAVPGPDCTVQTTASPVTRVRTQRFVCSDATMDISWEAFSPRITAAPLLAERRRLSLRGTTEGWQEDWLDTGNEPPGAWRIMRSGAPPFAIAVSVWVGGKPVRPGLTMRVRMALSSLFGSPYPPMLMTVTPAVEWTALNGSERRNAEASLPAFLLSHPALGRPAGQLSAR